MAETSVAHLWDPEVYERYKIYRDRPALDLLLQIPADLDPKEIWDLGCGTGEHAALLAARHPAARVHGLDSSAEMLAKAKARAGNVDWVQADIAAFAPATPPDLIFTNAALHWLADHAALFPRLIGMLAPGGVLACQMPVSGDQGWRTTARDMAREPRWTAKLGEVIGVARTPSAQDYYRWLAPLTASLDIWETTYLQVLVGDDPIVEWVSGTMLRPYVQALDEGAERDAFVAEYAARVADLFPKETDGATLMPFPRLFIVARRR